MFKKLASFLSGGSSSREHKLIVVGLDNSGKSTILGHLKPGGATTKVETVPTVGFSQEEFSKGNITFTAFDMSGQGRYRNLWEHYYKECQGIIFCIDSTDKIRLVVAKDELETMLEHADIRSKGIPLLFFANKMDRPQAISAVDCVTSLELDKITDHPWHIAQSNALTGEGLDDGITWLSNQLARGMRKN